MSEYVIYDLESYPNIFTYCAVDSDGEQIFDELSNSTVTLVDVPDW